MSEVRGPTKRHGDVLAVDDLRSDVEPDEVAGCLLLGRLRPMPDDGDR